jgi:VWFA-related protein
MNRTSLVWIFFFCLSFPVFAQQSNVPADNAGRRITLDVVVADRAGKPVSGLQQQDFAVTDDKKPQSVVSFHAVDGSASAADPIQIILLVDEVNTSFQSIAFERDALKKFLGRDGGKLPVPVSMVFFSDTGTEMQNAPSLDGNALIASFESHETKLHTIRRSAGFYGAVERYQLSLRTLQSLASAEAAKPGRKILIWISPGWPYLSGPRVNLTRQEEDGLFRSIVSLSSALRQARVTVYSVDPLGTADSGGLRTFYYEEFLKGVAKPKDAQAGNLALQVIAVQSGGRVLNGNNDLAGLIATAAADASTYYVLSIDPPPAENVDEYHAVEVKTERPGVTVHARTGYYGQP